MSRVATCLASADDFRRFFGREPPEIWFGLMAIEGEEIVGMGIVRHDEYGRAWGSLTLRKRLLPLLMHRTALRVLAALSEAEEPCILTFCDTAIAGAEKWLQRLGFLPVPELTVDPNYPTWRRALADG